jgi:hypothetical protein
MNFGFVASRSSSKEQNFDDQLVERTPTFRAATLNLRRPKFILFRANEVID